VQEQIFAEVSKAMGSEEQVAITADMINSLQFVKAAVKETFRLVQAQY